MISGVVRDQTGKPVESARVYFTGGPEPFPDVAALTGPDGRFVLSAPSEGTYTLESSGEGTARASATVDVRNDEETAVEIRLQEP